MGSSETPWNRDGVGAGVAETEATGSIVGRKAEGIGEASGVAVNSGDGMGLAEGVAVASGAGVVVALGVGAGIESAGRQVNCREWLLLVSSLSVTLPRRSAVKCTE